MMEQTDKKRIGPLIGRFLGGAIFCAGIGAIGCLWIEQGEPPIQRALQGLMVGGIVGGYLASALGNVQAKSVGSLLGMRSSIQFNGGFASDLVRGAMTARFICTFFGIPFTVLMAAVTSCVISIASLAIDGIPAGAEAFISVMDGAFWFCGLYLCVTLFVAAVSWILQCLIGGIRYLNRRRRASMYL